MPAKWLNELNDRLFPSELIHLKQTGKSTEIANRNA